MKIMMYIDSLVAYAIRTGLAEELKAKYTFTRENTAEILREEVGQVFAKVLEHAGVYARTEEGKAAFLRFVDYVNR